MVAPAAPAPHAFNLDPLLPVAQRFIQEVDIAQSTKPFLNAADSSAFYNAIWASFRSLPYALAPKQPLVQTFDNGLSCRVRYLEVALMSSVSAIYNLVFSVFFGAATLLTLGKIQMIKDQFNKQAMHTVLAGASVAIGLAGTLSPLWGEYVTGAVTLGLIGYLIKTGESNLVSKVGAAYQRCRSDLRTATLQAVEDDRQFFNFEFAPLFNYLDANLNQNVRSFAEFYNVMRGTVRHLPNVGNFISPNLMERIAERIGTLRA